MTYPIEYCKQVLSSIADGMSIREAFSFYELSASTVGSWQLAVGSWQQHLVPKTKRNKAPIKIPHNTLMEDVKIYPDDYN
ncbi:IS630 transposase-related protein [Psychrobacter sp.]|uniref:IS630 transposase-related protein n=1 Tax=Psychrobacter sp. TaxID=56811 RepID=UPI003C78D53F